MLTKLNCRSVLIPSDQRADFASNITKNTECFLSVHSVLGSLLSALCTLAHLICKTLFFCFVLFFWPFLGLLLRHMEIPRLLV